MGGKETKLYGDDARPNLSPHLGVWGVQLGLRGKGMVSSGKVSGIAFVLLVNVICVLVHAVVGVHVHMGVIMCALVRIHVHVCIALPIVVDAWTMVGSGLRIR